MAITVGEDTYATLAEIEAVISDYNPSKLADWQALTIDQQESAARVSTNNIEEVPYIEAFYTTDDEQELVFPLPFWTAKQDIIEMKKIKRAQALEACNIGLGETDEEIQLANIEKESDDLNSVTYSSQSKQYINTNFSSKQAYDIILYMKKRYNRPSFGKSNGWSNSGWC
jgi:hypothetical protein